MPEEVLRVEKLCSGDRPSVYAAGMLLAHTLKQSNLAVISVDVLGQIVLLPSNSVRLLSPVRVRDDDLDALPEDDAINLMAKEGRETDEIMSYIKSRKHRENNGK
jgi:hypothetical protein